MENGRQRGLEGRRHKRLERKKEKKGGDDIARDRKRGRIEQRMRGTVVMKENH